MAGSGEGGDGLSGYLKLGEFLDGLLTKDYDSLR
jgi:hypothetical protein